MSLTTTIILTLVHSLILKISKLKNSCLRWILGLDNYSDQLKLPSLLVYDITSHACHGIFCDLFLWLLSLWNVQVVTDQVSLSFSLSIPFHYQILVTFYNCYSWFCCWKSYCCFFPNKYFHFLKSSHTRSLKQRHEYIYLYLISIYSFPILKYLYSFHCISEILYWSQIPVKKCCQVSFVPLWDLCDWSLLSVSMATFPPSIITLSLS